MKKALLLALIIMFCATTAFSANFGPTLLKLSADPIIKYDFGGSELSIPVQVGGTTAGIILCVFTKDQAENIAYTQNGNLGWHMVNKIDTCLYYSTLKSCSAGANTITWDGEDQDGGVVPAGDYTYYLWAYDNMGAKQPVCNFIDASMCYSYYVDIEEFDESGLPSANPIVHKESMGGWGHTAIPYRWKIGDNPLDEALLETALIPMAEGWTIRGDTFFHPTDFSYFYGHSDNPTLLSGAIQKWKWIPGGDCEMQSDFGDAGYSDIHSTKNSNYSGPGVITDGEYLYSGTQSADGSNEPFAPFYIYDFDGTLITELDLSEFWCDPDDLAAGGQMNGGPMEHSYRNGRVLLNSHCSCMNNLVDPIAYLDSEDMDDFWLWTNGNGDYILDHNYEDTAANQWVCNDFMVGAFKMSADIDAHLFSNINASGIGTMSFGLFAPDGSGIGNFLYAGETDGAKGGTIIVDSDTAFDGLYVDDTHHAGMWYDADYDLALEVMGLFFLGGDVISGVITSAVGVEEAAPAAFSVAQNAPNPFNPTTTISFNLVDAGNVSIEVYNVAGQKVDTIVDGFMDAGSHSVVWDASGFSAGVYFYTVKSGEFSRTMKMTLLK